MLLQNKNAVIYGGGGAISGAVARTFAREGAKVFLAGRTLAKLEKVARDISAAGGTAEMAEVDALDETAVERHADRVAARAGGIMKRVMVRYKVKADRAAENERYIAKVFEQLRREKPPGLRYASFKLDDGVSFVHIVSFEAAEGTNPLGGLSAFKAFTADIRDRCEEQPVAVDLKEVGSYEFFA